MTSKSFPESRICLGIFILSVGLNLAVSAVGFRNSLQEMHEFRQLQTALTTRSIQESGFHLAYPTPLFGPPWSAPMEFPVYQLVVIRLAALTGLPLEPAGRLVALAFLYLALPACFSLAGMLGLPGPRRWLLPSLILLSPVYIYYSRSFMIESTALCASVWFLLAYIRALVPRAHRWLAAAILFGLIAALAKVTTFILFLVAAAVYTGWLLWRQARGSPGWASPTRTALRALAATVPAVVTGIAWVRYSDAVKLSNPLSAFLVSDAMSTFTFGTLAQRLTPVFWERITYHSCFAVASPFNLTLIALFALILGTASRWRALLLILGFAAGPLIFANLYFVHDYYFYACGTFLLGALVLAWSQLLDLPTFSPAAKWSVIGLSLGLQFFTYLENYFPMQRRPQDQPPEIATLVAAATKPEDVVLIFGEDWNAMTSYYAHRRTVMVPDGKLRDAEVVNAVLDRFAPGQVTALVVTREMRNYPSYFVPFIQRLHLHPTAVLVSPYTVVYLAETRLDLARVRLETLSSKEFQFIVTDGPGTTIPRVRYSVAQLADAEVVAMMTPTPAVIFHPFTPTAHFMDGKAVFNAHAPTDVVFELTAGATEATAEFGILPAAYEGKNTTEGVEFRVELITLDGKRRTLHSTYLSPSHRPADRGDKTLRVPLPAGARGQVWFRTLPGPTGSIACAWAYWSRIDLK
jgi:hypothetical protein